MASSYHEIKEDSVDQFFAKDEQTAKLRKFLLENEYLLMVFSSVIKDGTPLNMKLVINIKNLELEGQGLAVSKTKARVPFDEEKFRMSKYFNVMDLGDLETEFNPYSLTHSSIKNMFMPFFNHIKNLDSEQAAQSKLTTEKKVVNTIQKKLSDLNITLIQNNSDIEIEEVTLVVDERMKKFIADRKAASLDLMVPAEEVPVEVMDAEGILESITSSLDQWDSMVKLLFEKEKTCQFNSILDEVKFYSSYLKCLTRMDSQMSSPEVILIKTILESKRKFRVSAKLNLESLRDNLQNCSTINSLMQEIPIARLLSANEFKDVADSVINIWDYFEKIILVRSYSQDKIQNLISSFSKDLNKRLRYILKEGQILDMPKAQFEEFIAAFKQVSFKWEYKTSRVKESLIKHRQERGSGTRHHIDLNTNTLSLNERVDSIKSLRDQHENLRETFADILARENPDENKGSISNFMKIEDIDKAFSHFRNIDIFNCSREGIQRFNSSKTRYESEIDVVERTIINKIRELLGAASNSSEMFRVFKKFSSLLKRP